MKTVLITAALAAASVAAQVPGERVMVTQIGVGTAGVEAITGGAIKGQPYTAEVITESTQVLADGNRITHKSTALVARDSQGRTRHEARINAIGSLPVHGEFPAIVMIHDPVEQVTYTLESRSKTARKMSAHVPAGEGKSAAAVRGAVVHSSGAPESGTKQVFVHAPAGGTPAQFVYRNPSERTTTESLGVKAIEGVVAEGKRVTTTIAAADIGAERDIQVVNEVWTAQDLKAVVYSKRSDPRTGETIYRLANIQRAEPPASLFQVPADYKVEEGLPKKTILWQSKDE